ncbi:hypothetical protein E3N88_33818 [Mikania micrantha]|uniref:Uncharacterized protein n=1 Tax=Mikania micrantha TaxID=192012 RepID=A0A5N6MCS1_9ASTR|nr:hypothetical protein E3N88_33818 [Mikania micrantha]
MLSSSMDGCVAIDVSLDDITRTIKRPAASVATVAVAGIAEIVYSRIKDVLSAVKRYNIVQIYEKSMKIEMVGINLVAPIGSLLMAYNSWCKYECLS